MIDPDDRRQWPHAIQNYTGVAVRVVSQGEVLWVHRRDDQTWAFPGGGRRWEDGKNGCDAAENVLYDEVGIDAFGLGKCIRIWGITSRNFIVYTLAMKKRPRIALNTEKFSEYKWVPEKVELYPMHEPQREFFWL